MVSNYPVITMITAVITEILVFWVRKRQNSGNAVTLYIHLFDLCIQGNYQQRFISTLLSDGRTPDLSTQTATNNPTQTTPWTIEGQ